MASRTDKLRSAAVRSCSTPPSSLLGASGTWARTHACPPCPPCPPTEPLDVARVGPPADAEPLVASPRSKVGKRQLAMHNVVALASCQTGMFRGTANSGYPLWGPKAQKSTDTAIELGRIRIRAWCERLGWPARFGAVCLPLVLPLLSERPNQSVRPPAAAPAPASTNPTVVPMRVAS